MSTTAYLVLSDAIKLQGAIVGEILKVGPVTSIDGAQVLAQNIMDQVLLSSIVKQDIRDAYVDVAVK